ncbi:MAG: hypothetical protein PT944_03830 [Actinomycetaceae bacterium]|nr:hypothetical protein [Arcanobacterium sp.]MDD7687033.1 hypothetical protein [Actinomycetaceae bacterium]MDY5273310.1 hypothetical protein [Arcanobacterium sp.]
MSDADVQALLRWLAAHDPYPSVVLCCEHTEMPALERHELGVVWNGCLADAHPGLLVQLFAFGVQRAVIVPCTEHPQRVRQRVRGWQQLSLGRVQWYTAGNKNSGQPRRRWQRRGEMVRVGAVPFPRRALFALYAHTPIDIHADAMERTRQALELVGLNAGISELSDQAARISDQAANNVGAAGDLRSGGAQGGGLESTGGADNGDEVDRADDTGAAGGTSRANDAGTDNAGNRSAAGVEAISLLATRCNACGVCVHVCGKNALTIALRPDTEPSMDSSSRMSLLMHERTKCRGCRQCIVQCPIGALSQQQGTISWAELDTEPTRVLASVRTRRCPQCSARYDVREGELCALCSYRQTHPFESVKTGDMARIWARRFKLPSGQ